ncbi:PlsC domain-containing protein [Phanerochaete sordida]|uniref:PlsC domain-containing protein n=1 Tax=Phanerochaete sordida TaxID=48140 RepID=A0A9P3GGQ3_9APHY|nr:PlsC domain-containing protein [Phanerochaete sordida]
MAGKGSPTPWSYFLIRLLFKFVLKIFYGTIVVEGTEHIPLRGRPCIVCANHSNSLTDALVMVATVPSKRRDLLRLTAKSTQFGKRTFTSWLIESAGTVPLQRRKDFPDGKVNNTEVMEKLLEALEQGDAVCLFPEGMSRYHPTIAPLKTGVARIVSDVLTRQRDDPTFEVDVLTCSITYMHRQHFRSDVLVTFHKPMTFSPATNPELLAPVEFSHIRDLTAKLHHEISMGTLSAPSWRLHRNAKLAAQIYAPLGTEMTLGDYVRVVRMFLEALKVPETKDAGAARGSASEGEMEGATRDLEERLACLSADLTAYQEKLSYYGIKDDRIRRPLSRPVILYRLTVRLSWSLVLFSLSLPGLLLWLPVFVTTFIAVREFKRTGPVWDTWDEIAQYKLVYGLISGLCVWCGAMLVTLPVAPITAVVVPVMMWMALRWFEDAVASFRAFAALARLFLMPRSQMVLLQATRRDLHKRVVDLAVNTLGLPEHPETYFAQNPEADGFTGTGREDKGRVRGPWQSKAKYFSIRRRRKRDWNETLRLYDKVDYGPEDY